MAYPNISEKLTVFFRDDMSEAREEGFEVWLSKKNGKVELEINSPGYGESWIADSLTELDELVKLNPAGM